MAVLVCCPSVAAYGQGKKARLKVWREEVKAGREFVKDYLDTAGLSNIPIAEYFKLKEVDIPKNCEKILRSHPCWVIKSAKAVGYRDGKPYAIVDEWFVGSPSAHLAIYKFDSNGFWRFYVKDTLFWPEKTKPRVEAKFIRYDAPIEEFPLEVFMCGENNRFVVGYESIMFDDQTPKGAGWFLMHLIEPASREQLKEIESLIKKSAVVAQYYQDILDFVKENNL